jgi:acyl-CoA thioesterase-1
MQARRWRFSGAMAICVLLAGCGPGPDRLPMGETVSESRQALEKVVSPGHGPAIVALGDSLTAGLGLDPDEAYPALLERQLRSEGFALRVVNAGVSGDTSAAGLRRAEWAMDGDVRIVIVALGGNDGLRGLPADQMKQNLVEIVSMARARGIAVLLAGMEAPPNFGSTYTTQFREVFVEVAADFDLTFMPFLLAGVAADPELNQADGIHPNPEGARIVAAGVRASLEPLLSALTVEAP